MKKKNWKTTVFGIIGGAAMVIAGFMKSDMSLITSGFGVLGLGVSASDHQQE